MSDNDQKAQKWYKSPQVWLSILLILSLLALIGVIIASMFYVPVSDIHVFDFPNLTRVKIVRQNDDMDVSSTKIKELAPLMDDKPIDETIVLLHKYYGAVSIRRDNRVVSRGYIDPLEPIEAI
jgi:hypothetical protein